MAPMGRDLRGAVGVMGRDSFDLCDRRGGAGEGEWARRAMEQGGACGRGGAARHGTRTTTARPCCCNAGGAAKRAAAAATP